MDVFSHGVKTPYGQVSLKCFPSINHREVVLEELSRVLLKPLSLEMMVFNAQGKPELPKEKIQFNWTHSQDICILAYSFDCLVGVDLEFHRNRSLEIAKRFFSKEEQRYLFETISIEEERLREFYRLWARKEALYKCCGTEFIGGDLSVSVIENNVRNVIFFDLQGGFSKEHSFCLAVAHF